MRSLRFWIILVGSIIVIGSILAIASVWKWDVGFGLPRGADKVTRINTIVAASAYIAAIVAAVFALIAYWQASGLPSLKPEIEFFPLDAPLWATSREPPPWVKNKLATLSISTPRDRAYCASTRQNKLRQDSDGGADEQDEVCCP